MKRRSFLGSALAGLLSTALPAGLLAGGPAPGTGPPSAGGGPVVLRTVVHLFRRGVPVGSIELRPGARVSFEAGVVRVRTPRRYDPFVYGFVEVAGDRAELAIRVSGPGVDSIEAVELLDGDLVEREAAPAGGLLVTWTRRRAGYDPWMDESRYTWSAGLS